MIGSSRATLVVVLIVGMVLLVAACAPATDAGPGQLAATATAGPESGVPDTPADSPLPTATDARDIRLTPGAKPLLEVVPTAMAPAVTGEVPADLLAAIVADLAGQEEISTEQIEVVRAESVVWPDGSLGCPQPGMNYIQMQIDGYWVVLAHGGQTFDYRATQDGYFRLCPSPGPVPPSSSGDTE